MSNPQHRKVVHYNRLKPYESNEEDDSIIWAKLNKQPETETQCESFESEQQAPTSHNLVLKMSRMEIKMTMQLKRMNHLHYVSLQETADCPNDLDQ